MIVLVATRYRYEYIYNSTLPVRSSNNSSDHGSTNDVAVYLPVERESRLGTTVANSREVTLLARLVLCWLPCISEPPERKKKLPPSAQIVVRLVLSSRQDNGTNQGHRRGTDNDGLFVASSQGRGAQQLVWIIESNASQGRRKLAKAHYPTL
jgi:hypothetical protein